MRSMIRQITMYKLTEICMFLAHNFHFNTFVCVVNTYYLFPIQPISSPFSRNPHPLLIPKNYSKFLTQSQHPTHFTLTRSFTLTYTYLISQSLALSLIFLYVLWNNTNRQLPRYTSRLSFASCVHSSISLDNDPICALKTQIVLAECRKKKSLFGRTHDLGNKMQKS